MNQELKKHLTRMQRRIKSRIEAQGHKGQKANFAALNFACGYLAAFELIQSENRDSFNVLCSYAAFNITKFGYKGIVEDLAATDSKTK